MPLVVPPYAKVSLTTLTPWSWESLGVFLPTYRPAIATTSNAWPASNLSLLVPFSTWQALTIKEVTWWNGTGTLGNVDIGIYAADGATLLASLGSTAKGGASLSVTTTTWTDYVLPAGDYYMAIACDDGTKTFTSMAIPAGPCAALGVLEAGTNFPLATAITPVVTTRAYVPLFGLLLDSLAV